MRPRCFALSVFFLLAAISAAAAAQPQAASRPDAGPLPSIEEKTAGMKKLDGYFPLYWDERTGQLWLEIARFNTEVLHSTGFGAGLGSNDIGLDRGALAGSRIVVVRARGPEGADGAAQLPVPRRDSTEPASSRAACGTRSRDRVLWGFTVAAESGGRVLVDATEFLVRDAHQRRASGCGPAATASTRRAARSTCR